MMSRPLRRILTRNAALVVGLPFLLMFILGVCLLFPQEERHLANHQREVAAAIGTQVETYLESSRAMVVATAADVDRHLADEGKVEDYLLVAVVKASPLLRAMYVVDGNGRIVTVANREGAGTSNHDLLGTDLSRNPLVESVTARHVEQWSDNYLSLVQGGIVVALAVPCGKGALVGELELDRLSHFLKKIETHETLDIFILDSRGQVISARNGTVTAQQLNLSNIPVVRQAMSGGSGGTDCFTFEGRRMQGSTRALSAMKWSVLVAEPQDQVYRQMVTSGKIGAAGLVVALFLGLGLAFMFARTLACRFERLAEQAHLVATGTGPAHWPHAGILELDNLASSLQRMSDTLHERALLLEQEIADREKVEEVLRERNEELAAIEEELRQQVEGLIQTQEELARREEEFRTVADWTYDWEYWISPDKCLLYMSPSCERVSGYSPGDFMSDPGLMDRIVHPDDRHIYRNHLSFCLSPEGTVPEETAILEFRIIGRDGTVHWIEHVCRPVFSSTGSFLGRRASNRDVTEKRLLEQQLLQQQKLESVGMLAGGIAHDFNNMLTPIVGYADMIKAKAAPGDGAAAWATSILDAAEKAKNLVKQLLSFSRKQVLSVRRHDLNVIVENFSDVLRRTIREDIVIRSTLSTAASAVDVDRTQVEQILLNLAVNAQDAIAGPGTIAIETAHTEITEEDAHRRPAARAGRFILLTFTDSGCGMDETVLDHIFEPFFTTKAVGRGTGLGLSTTYGIIKQHNGFLEVSSRPGKGTTFFIYLPEAEAGKEAAALPVVPHMAERGGSGTILVVEDNDMVLRMLRDLLETHGYRVLTAGLPEDALGLVKTVGPIDLLVSDVVMPQMSGPEMAERMSLLLPGLKVLFLSGYASSSVLPRDFSMDRADFISKPFSSELLLQRIDALINKDHSRVQSP